jgi:hypothetical protein
MPTTTATPIEIWCLVIDQENKPIGSFFSVLHAGHIADLKNEVKKAKPNALRNIDADELVVWRYTNRSTVLEGENIEEKVRELFSNEEVEKTGETTMVAKLRIQTNEKLLVKMPGVFSPSSFKCATLTSVVQNDTWILRSGSSKWQKAPPPSVRGSAKVKTR